MVPAVVRKMPNTYESLNELLAAIQRASGVPNDVAANHFFSIAYAGVHECSTGSHLGLRNCLHIVNLQISS
jgi:hypothetical protein